MAEPAVPIRSTSDIQFVLRSFLINQVLSQKTKFDRGRLLQLLQTFVVLSLFESLLDPIFQQLPVIPRYFCRGLRWLAAALKERLMRHRPRVLAPTSVTRTGHLQAITPDYKINELFTSVEWYVNLHLKREPPAKKNNVQYARVDSKSAIVTALPEDTRMVIPYAGEELHVHMHSDTIDILADRTYKRKNRHIDISVSLPEEDERDIIDQFVTMCDDKYKAMKQKENKKPTIYKNVGDRWQATGGSVRRRPETVILRGNMREQIFQDLDQFFTAEDWYISRDVPYTRHYLFHGPPGTGKTSLIKAIADKYGRSPHFLQLSEITSDRQLSLLFQAVPMSDSILVIEDMDCASSIVRPRDTSQETKEDDSGKDPDTAPPSTLTLSGLLNAIDGATLNVHGQIMIVTTNCPDAIDPALLRAGRIDRRFEFTLCDAAHASAMFTNFFNRETAVIQGEPVKPLSPADVAGIFITHRTDSYSAERALYTAWRGTNKT